MVIMLKSMKSLRQLYAMTMVRSLVSPFKGGVNMIVRRRMSTPGIGHLHMILSLRGSTSGSFSLWVLVRTAWYWTMSSTSCLSLEERTSSLSKRTAARTKRNLS